MATPTGFKFTPTNPAPGQQVRVDPLYNNPDQTLVLSGSLDGVPISGTLVFHENIVLSTSAADKGKPGYFVVTAPAGSPPLAVSADGSYLTLG